MLFNSTASGSVQLWRQRFPDGRPEQVTSGTTAVSGIAPTPGDRADGQSITYSSIGPDGNPMHGIARIDGRSPPRQLSAGEAWDRSLETEALSTIARPQTVSILSLSTILHQARSAR
jgi:hypothetical protein